MRLSKFASLVKKSAIAWSDDYAASMGAAIAYYTVFSIAPLLIIVIAVAGWIWGPDAVRGEIVAQLAGLIGRDGAAGVQAIIEASNRPTGGLVASAVGVVVLVIGATTVFGELQSALDRIWRTPAAPQVSGLWNLIHSRLLSFGLVLGLAFLMSASLVFSAGLTALGRWGSGIVPATGLLLQIGNQLLSLGISTVLFAMIYKLMPRASVAWRDVWVGACVTSLLFAFGKWLIGLYVGKSGVTSSFAAAGSVVVLLVWVYYAAQIFLLGAEFTWVYANEHGSRRVRPSDESAAPVPTRQSVAASGADSGAVSSQPAPMRPGATPP